MQINVRCGACGKSYQLEVPEEGYREWRAGIVIQSAMPNLSKDDRELLISGTCKVCWDEMMKDMDEGEEYHDVDASMFHDDERDQT